MAKTTTVYQLKITLGDIRPPIWRRLQTPDCTLARLHDIIQLIFDWEDYHMWEFTAGGRQYGTDPEGDLGFARPDRMKLSRLTADGVKKFTYTYDFGDTWVHTIVIEKNLAPAPGVKYPRCIAGARAGPPEDCGGPWGYVDFVDAIRNPRHERHDELLDWIGGEFDPEAFSVEEVTKDLARLR
jgi:hypothetical protein